MIVKELENAGLYGVGRGNSSSTRSRGRQTTATAWTRLLREGCPNISPFSQTRHRALAAQKILTHCNQKFLEEFCDAYGSQVPPDIAHEAALKTVYYKSIKTVIARRNYLVSRFNFDLMDEAYCLLRVALYGHLNDLQTILTWIRSACSRE